MPVGSISTVNNIQNVYGNGNKQPVKTKENKANDTYKGDYISLNSREPYSYSGVLNTFHKGGDYANISVKYFGGEAFIPDLEYGRTFSVLAANQEGSIKPFLAQSAHVGFGLSEGGIGYKLNAGVEVNNVSVSLTGQASVGIIPFNLTPYFDARGGIEFRANVGQSGGSITINPNYGVTKYGSESTNSFGVAVGYALRKY